MSLSPKILKEKHYSKILDALVEFYTERPSEYGFWDERVEVYKEYADFVSSHVPNKAYHLDLGTGTWHIANELSEYDYEKVIGLDYFSDEDLKRLNDELSSKDNAEIVKYLENDKIPFDDQSFNSLSSLCVVEHIVFVEKLFNEMDRVLKPGGRLIIECPNWSGPNPAITGMIKNLKGERFWLYNSFKDSFFALFRSLGWYLKNLFTSGEFIMIHPRMKGDKIDFEFSDDDVVHLCQPLSIKKFFLKKGYKVKMYNRGSGKTAYSKIFNILFPSLATTNQLVFEKSQ